MNNTSRTDWARIDAMSDDEIDTSDIPPLTNEFFSKAKLRMPLSSLATVAITSGVRMKRISDDKAKIRKTREDFIQKSEDFLNTEIDVTAEFDPIIEKLRRLIKFLDENPITAQFLQQTISSYPHDVEDHKDKLIQAINEDEIENFDDVSDEQNISFFYWIMKSILQINKISNRDHPQFCNQDYYLLSCIILGDNRTLGLNLPDIVNKFNKDYVRPYFINPIRSYLDSLIIPQK